MVKDRWERVCEQIDADLESGMLPEDIERKYGIKAKTGYEYFEWHNKRVAEGKCVFSGVYTLYCIGNGFKAIGREIARVVVGEREDDFPDMMNQNI